MRKRAFSLAVGCLVLAALPLFAVGPATVTIADTIYRADGTAASGNLQISWPQFTTAEGKAVFAGQQTATIGTGGTVSIALIPNEGATPSGTFYTVKIFAGAGTPYTEYWIVPASGPVTIAAVRVASVGPVLNVLSLTLGGTGAQGFTPLKCVQANADGSKLVSAAAACGSGGGGASVGYGAIGSRPAAGTTGNVYCVNDSGSMRCTRDNGATWDDLKTSWNYVDSKPSTFAPSAHASTHQNGGGDEVATATAGANAIPKAGSGGTLGTAWIPDLSATYLPLHSKADTAGAADTAAALSAQYVDYTAASGATSIKNKPALGGAAALNVGTTTGTVAAGDDSRMTNARAPTAHASTHVTGGSDVIASAVAAGNAGLMTGADKTKLDGIAAGATVGADWNSNVTNKPTLGGAAALNVGAATGTVAAGDDSRMTNARTPTAHASTHQNGGGDEIATATAAANAIPKAGSGGQFAAGWMPALTGDVTTTAGAVATTIRAALGTRTAKLTLSYPATGDSGKPLILDENYAVHITRAYCATYDATNVVLNLDKRAEATYSTDSTHHLLGSDLTATTSGANTTTFANGSAQCGGTSSCAVAAHTPVVLTITSVSGSPTALTCAFDYTVD